MKSSLGQRLLLGLGLVTMSACSPKVDVQVVRYRWVKAPTARANECQLPIYKSEEAPPAGCVAVGDVFIGDTGGTTDCGLDRMLAEVRVEACQFGADAAQIVYIARPKSMGSSCHEVRAAFFRCPSLSAGRTVR